MPDNSSSNTDQIADDLGGFVFGVSGREYADLAVRAARSLRAVAPDALIDIFTDVDVPDDLFDQVHPLEQSWFRPKFEALRRSRFARTVCLDADMFIVADPSDILEELRRFDVAACHNQRRNTDWSRRPWRKEIPAAFPQINGGLIGIRKGPEVLQMIEACEAAIRDENLRSDQPVLRELLYDSDLRLTILPPEYNLVDFDMIETWTQRHTAPRIIHHYRLRFHIQYKRRAIESLDALMGRRMHRHLQHLLEADATLGTPTRARVRRVRETGPLGRLRLAWAKMGEGKKERR